jgi:hypothetical protein
MMKIEGENLITARRLGRYQARDELRPFRQHQAETRIFVIVIRRSSLLFELEHYDLRIRSEP